MYNIEEELERFTEKYDVPDYMKQEIINRYQKYISKTKGVDALRYLCTYICVTTIPEIEQTNEAYRKTLHELCESGTAEFWQEGDLVIFFNWDVCVEELVANFGINW